MRLFTSSVLRQTLSCLVAVIAVVAMSGRAAVAADPLVEQYLRDGRLEDGAKALAAQLQKTPADQQAQYGLGVIRFLQSFEHLGSSLYRYGLRTSHVARMQVFGVDRLVEQNPNPETLTYPKLRGVFQTWLDDLAAADAELAKVTDKNVKLPLHVGQVKLNLVGQGPVHAAALFSGNRDANAQKRLQQTVVAFDHADAVWLRGYLHFLSAWGELLLAVDGQETFDTTGHLFFQKVESPYAFLQEGDRDWNSNWWNNRAIITDILAWLHTMRFPLKEPKRMQAVLGHLEATVKLGQEMWPSILAETDDDHEWIPNPQQTGVLGVKVTHEMITVWQATLIEADHVLQGKKLIPFWRGTKPDRGLNLRRVFTEPRGVDPFLWWQGTAAAPYLETGPITHFATENFARQIGGAFGSNFVGFAIWFN